MLLRMCKHAGTQKHQGVVHNYIKSNGGKRWSTCATFDAAGKLLYLLFMRVVYCSIYGYRKKVPQ